MLLFIYYLLPCKFIILHNHSLFHPTVGSKRRHQLRKKIAAEKEALDDVIAKYNTVVGDADKLPPPDELLVEDNFSWPWECK